METSRYLVYVLCDPRTGAVRYVGKSCYGLQRPKRHGTPKNMADRAHLPVVCWIRSLRGAGVDYTVEIIEEFDTPSDLDAAECLWIAQFRAWGFDLLNVTDGGDGTHGYKQSREHVEKRLASLRGKPSWNKGVAVPKERRASHGGRAVVDESGVIYASVSEAARKLGFSREYVTLVLQGRYTAAGGQKIKYLERQ